MPTQVPIWIWFRSPPTPTPTDTPSPPTLEESLETLCDFPLASGNTWVYSATYYGYYFEGEINSANAVAVTATYVITDQVVTTDVKVPFFVARVQRQSTLVSGTPFERFYGLDFNWTLADPAPKVFWYIVAGGRVYQQDDLDFTRMREWGSFVPFYFPLADKAGFKCWYPDGYEQDCRTNDWWSGYFYVDSGPVSERFPAGNLDNCYQVGLFVRGGGVNRWICLGTGFAGSEWEYHGQSSDMYPPIGYRIMLTSYSLAPMYCKG